MVEERTQIHNLMYLGRDHQTSASKLTNFLTQPHRYELDKTMKKFKNKTMNKVKNEAMNKVKNKSMN